MERRFRRKDRLARLAGKIPKDGQRSVIAERRLKQLLDDEERRHPEEDEMALSMIGKLRKKLGSRGAFLVFATMIGAAITLSYMYWERYTVEVSTGADPKNEAQVGLGHTLYTQHCAFCHGAELQGQAGWEGNYPNGGRPALPLNGSGAIWRLSDHDLFDVTKYGGQAFSPKSYKNEMPAFETQLAEADIWAILAYMKSYWPQEVIAKQLEAEKERLREAK